MKVGDQPGLAREAFLDPLPSACTWTAEYESRHAKMFLGLRDRKESAGLRWGGLLTHSKCFLIFSDSAYLEIPLMKRVRLTWGRREQVYLPVGGLQMSQRIQGGARGGAVEAGLRSWSGLSGVFVIEA